MINPADVDGSRQVLRRYGAGRAGAREFFGSSQSWLHSRWIVQNGRGCGHRRTYDFSRPVGANDSDRKSAFFPGCHISVVVAKDCLRWLVFGTTTEPFLPSHGRLRTFWHSRRSSERVAIPGAQCVESAKDGSAIMTSQRENVSEPRERLYETQNRGQIHSLIILRL